jgi:hypothetical protein
MRFLYSPDDYSPTFDIESDGNRNFVKLHAIYSIPPDLLQSRKMAIDQSHIDYISGDGWKRILDQRDWLKLKT